MKRTRASAVARSRPATLSRPALFGPAGGAEIAEEIAIRREEKGRVVPGKRLAVGLERAIKGEEIDILAKGVGVDLDARPVAFAAQHLRLALRLGEEHGALLLGDRADALRELGALGAELAGLAL